MNSALDDVAFLALSENRIALLAGLSDEQTHTRDELMDATNVSRPTLGRILGDLEERAWITQYGQNVQITSLGAWVHDEFTDLLAMMDTARQLRPVEEWLSADILTFELSCLTDASVTLPSQNKPLAPMYRASELERTARQSQVLTHALPAPCLNAHWKAITTGTHHFEAVVTPSVVTAMTDPARRSQFTDILMADQATMYVSDDPIPNIVGVNDGVVYFGVDDDKGAPLALIETDNETVRTWATETFQSYQQDASLLTSDRFAQIQETAPDSNQMEELLTSSHD
ncbi:helix-turn-helix transcriptional regulator [Haloarcula nitratireducens]|uniref:ArsR family transcriptional regulator n=1 Tax=Haloarcula nitratireducens TaxID=2487749 RepID=A0AAW4PKH0_9EURY|nr:ArsR family transcriptional regulator [Halomicroarcula nitratireducens]MBX0297941.1 ArsR family transcriptional regulator [Halomicroarcula nitratireducens]